LPSGLTAIPCQLLLGAESIENVVTTALVFVLITETVSGPLAAYSRLPSGLSARPNGLAPTVIVATVVVVAVGLITVTLLEPRLLT
jgi:hypothetical protein